MTRPSPVPPEASPSRKPAGAGKIILLILLGIFVGAAGYINYDARKFLDTPASKNPVDVILDVQPGATFDKVARDLYKEGAITDVFRFRILAKLKRQTGSIKAGEFLVNTGWTPGRVLEHLTSGKSLLYRLSIREGLPWWEVARLVEEGGFAKADAFEAVIHDPEFLRQYGIPFANAEGFLYPETYLLRKPKTMGGREQAETVARILVEAFWKHSWKTLENYAASDAGPKGTPAYLPDFVLKNGVPVRIPPRAEPARADRPPSGSPASPASPETGVPAVREKIADPPLQAPVSAETLRYLAIMASLVEKETGVPEERARVAGVYANRTRIGMALQCDPTIIYGLGKNRQGPIRRSQLDDAGNLYNTYKYAGLPPGPICSPGVAAIQAAANPETHQYLYFVATGQPDGTHTFSTNLRDHERAVRIYRAAQGR